jgi:hypothetical protein
MNEHAVITRLRRADPAAGRDVATDPDLRRARVEAILASSGPDPVVPPSRRPRSRRAVGVAVAVLAIPGAALAANAVFGPDDVERGLPAGARLLVGTHPTCVEVEPDVAYDCKLETAPTVEQSGSVPSGQPDWLGAVTLMVDRGDRINGGCRSRVSDGTAWRCYVGQAAADQQILDPNLLGTPIHDRCDGPGSSAPPTASPYSAAPGSAIILCGSRDIVGFAAQRAEPDPTP